MHVIPAEAEPRAGSPLCAGMLFGDKLARLPSLTLLAQREDFTLKGEEAGRGGAAGM